MIKLHDALNVEGVWWLPTNSEHHISGTLSFDQQNGALLDLTGTLKPKGWSDTEDADLIHGMTTKGVPVTLLGCFRKSSQLNFPGIAKEVHRANTVAMGLHFESEADPLFTKSAFRFEGIEKWLEAKLINTSVDNSQKTISVVSNWGSEIELAKLEGQSIAWGADVKTEQAGEIGITLLAEISISSELTNPASLNWHFKNAARIQALASACTGRHLPLSALRLKVADTAKHPKTVDVLAQIQHPVGDLRAHDRPMITLPELLKTNPNALQQWFDSYADLGTVIALIGVVQADKGIYGSLRFLLAIQALEAFHRTTHPGPIMTPGGYQKLVRHILKSLPNNTPPKMVEKLKTSTLPYANEPSLRQRMKAVRAGLKERYGMVPEGMAMEFFNAVVDTRNFHTHHIEELRSKALKGAEMHWATQRLLALLIVLFLERIGVPPSAIPFHLDRHRQFMHLWSKSGAPKY